MIFLNNINIVNTPQFFTAFTGFINSPPDNVIFILKIIFIILSLALFGFIIFSLSKSSWLKFLILEDLSEFFSFKPAGSKKTEKMWNKIIKRLDTGLESEYKLAVIEADNIVDDILKKMGFSGNALDERLKIINPVILPNVNQVKEIHQIRNNIIHDPDYKLSLEETKKILDVYEESLRELDAF